jgi:hypothetical protein
VVVRLQRLAGVVDDVDFAHVLGKGLVVRRELGDTRAQRRHARPRRLVWPVLARIEFIASGRVVALELPAPDPAKVDVDGPIVVGECGRVDREGFRDIVGLGRKGTFGLVG